MIAPTVTLDVKVPQAALSAGPPWRIANATVTYQGSETVGQVNGAHGGFIQTVNKQLTTDYAPSAAYPNGLTVSTNYPTDPDHPGGSGSLYALDVSPLQSTPYYIDDYNVPLDYQSTTKVGGIGAGYPSDAPGASVQDPVYGWAEDLTYTYYFHTYLDYQPPGGGLHVEVAESDWTVSVAAHYVGPPVNPDYTLEQNWSITTSTVSSPNSQSSGSPVNYSRQIITWITNVGDADPQYTTVL